MGGRLLLLLIYIMRIGSITDKLDNQIRVSGGVPSQKLKGRRNQYSDF